MKKQPLTIASLDSADVSSFPFAPPGERVEEDTLCERDSLNNWDVDKELESSSAVSTYVKNTKYRVSAYVKM
jgi:hypothetical protein